MKVLLDESLPERLRHSLPGHEVSTVRWMGWSSTKNDALLDLAETEFDVFITADQNLPYQQNLHKRLLAVIVLAALDNRLETLQSLAPDILRVLETIKPGQWVPIEVPSGEDRNRGEETWL